MKEYNSMYLGICINNDDPEKRGRVQVFIPHIMPALYDNWNETAQDINLTCVGDNLPSALTSDQIAKLVQILPWAESASPICGTSAPGNVVSSIGSAIAAGAKAVGNAVSSLLYDQSPVSSPNPITPTNNADLFAKATKYGGISPDEYSSNSSGSGKCGIGSRGVLGALTGNSYFAQGIGAGGNDTAGSLALGGGNNYLTNSGQFQPPVAMDAGALSDPAKIPVGTTVCAQGGHKGQGHIQVWTGSNWVSNFSQNPDSPSSVGGTNGVLASSGKVPYSNFTVYYPKDTIAPAGSPPASPVADRTSMSGQPAAAANVHSQSDPTQNNNQDEDDPAQGNAADPTVENNAASGGDLSSSAKAALDQARGSSTLTQVVNGSNANEISDDSNGNPYSMALEGGNGAGDTNTSLTDSTGKSIDAMNVPYIAVANKADIGKPFAVQINDGPPIVCIGADSSTSRGNGAVLGTNAAAGVNSYHGEISTAAMIAAGGGVVQGSSGLLKGTTLAPGATMSIAPITDGSIPSFSVKNPPTPEQLQQYYGSQLTADQKAQLQKLTDNAANKTGIAGTAGKQVGASSTALVNHPNPHGPPAIHNINNMAKGLFTYPAGGAMLWVFFREGNPLYPVYFAASYSKEEWASVYRTGSDSQGYKPGSTPDNPVTSVGTTLNMPGGGFRSHYEINPNDPSQGQQSMMVYGDDGSNMFMGKGYHQIFSKFDRRDQVEGDRWNTTLGFKEDWIQGDHNHVTMGDVYVKVGNVAQPAVDAVTRIQQIIKENQASLSDQS